MRDAIAQAVHNVTGGRVSIPKQAVAKKRRRARSDSDEEYAPRSKTPRRKRADLAVSNLKKVEQRQAKKEEKSESTSSSSQQPPQKKRRRTVARKENRRGLPWKRDCLSN